MKKCESLRKPRETGWIRWEAAFGGRTNKARFTGEHENIKMQQYPEEVVGPYCEKDVT